MNLRAGWGASVCAAAVGRRYIRGSMNVKLLRVVVLQTALPPAASSIWRRGLIPRLGLSFVTAYGWLPLAAAAARARRPCGFVARAAAGRCLGGAFAADSASAIKCRGGAAAFGPPLEPHERAFGATEQHSPPYRRAHQTPHSPLLRGRLVRRRALQRFQRRRKVRCVNLAGSPRACAWRHAPSACSMCAVVRRRRRAQRQVPGAAGGLPLLGLLRAEGKGEGWAVVSPACCARARRPRRRARIHQAHSISFLRPREKGGVRLKG